MRTLVATVSDEFHSKVKIEAFKQGKTMTQFVVESVEQVLKKAEKEEKETGCTR